MNRARRKRTPASGIRGALALLMTLAACDGLGGAPLQEPHARNASGLGRAGADGGTADAGDVAMTDAGDPYLIMCRHYCDALHDTDLYFCLSSEPDAAACSAPPTDLCFNDRCAPRLVQPSLCDTQCDALDRQYRAYCGSTDAAADCPAPPEAHDALCRAGCVLPPGADDAGADAGAP